MNSVEKRFVFGTNCSVNYMKVVRLSALGNGHLSPRKYSCYPFLLGACGGIVVKALFYKPAGRRFDSRWCHWNFSGT
jgi:hypothetical protein